ncbi:MAG: shikimate kinase [Planctomycetota bacterium]|nr:MAG: shikimate kinase [Planctomycetota bacterium]
MSAAIVLIGPRAAGKTTLGRRLAEQLGCDFVDADALLERRHGRTIADWLRADSAGFRRAEAALLGELLARSDAVVALGGGIVEDTECRNRLAAHPRVIALRAPVPELIARQRGSDRPPLTELPPDQETAAVWKRRFPRYHEACRGRWVDTAGSEEQAYERLLAAVRGLQSLPPTRGGAAGSSSGS